MATVAATTLEPEHRADVATDHDGQYRKRTQHRQPGIDPDDELVVAGATVGVAGVVSGDPGVPFPGLVFPGDVGTVDAVGGGSVVAVSPATLGSLGSALPPAVSAAWLLGVGSKRCVQPNPFR